MKRSIVPAVTCHLSPSQQHQSASPPSLDPTLPLRGTGAWASLPLSVAQIHIRIHSSAFASQITSAMREGEPLRISAGSVFRPIGSRVCWPTAPRWTPHRPCGRHLYSLVGQAAWCKRGGGDTSDTYLSAYCSLEKKRENIYLQLNETSQKCCPVHILPNSFLPPRLSSVSVFRVDEPTAVSRLMEWSVRLLQWDRSSFVKWGMWRITRRRVESLMSKPASRKHCMDRNWLRLSQPGPEMKENKQRHSVNLVKEREKGKGKERKRKENYTKSITW